ncbi:hypothetical protein Tco_1014541 [Tanacetum coccineum]
MSATTEALITDPTYAEAPLGYRAVGIRLRVASPPLFEAWESSSAAAARQAGRPMSKEVGYRITDTWDELVDTIQEIAPTTLEGVNCQYRLSYSDEGACNFTDRWRLDELAYGIPSDGPYQTNPPSIEDIISSIRIDQEGQVRRIRHEEEIDVHDYQILTREIIPTLKPLEEIIWENVFCLGGNQDHVPACLCFMLYCAVHSERFNLAYYMAKRMEWVTKQARLILPYGMLLTRLFTFIMNEYPKLNNESYVLYDRVMTPLAAQLERKPRRDRGMRRGRHSTSSSSAFDQPSSSHLNDDDDDGNDEGTSRASTPSPIRYVNSLTNQVPQVFQNPPNIDPHLEPFYTRQTEIINRQVQLRDEHRGGVRSIGKSLRRLWRNMKK